MGKQLEDKEEKQALLQKAFLGAAGNPL